MNDFALDISIGLWFGMIDTPKKNKNGTNMIVDHGRPHCLLFIIQITDVFII